MIFKLYKLTIIFFFKYPTPVNLNYLWNFGVLSLIFFILQVLTGIFLSMFYIPQIDFAFLSIENIMRNVSAGWLIRYLHANGASLFFIFVYLHFFRNLYYKTYLPPRRLTWLAGVFILLIMILTAFTGYVLPWGQMSFWAATVITNLFSSIPLFGNDIVLLLWGNYTVSNSTLNRFFSFHFLLPFILLILVFLHLIFLHEKGSSNPLKIYYFIDKVLFHPYFTIKDIYTIFLIIIFFIYLILINPNLLGHSDNYIQANPLVTPSHIVPEWYFLLFYAILRAVPSKLGGFLTLLLSIFILLIFPFFIKKSSKYFFNFKLLCLNWLNNLLLINRLHSYFNYPSSYYFLSDKFLFKFLIIYNLKKFYFFFYNFLFVCFFLSILGSYPAEGFFLLFSKVFMLLYFCYFLFLVLDLNSLYFSFSFFYMYFYLIYFYINIYIYYFFIKNNKKFKKKKC